MYINLNQFYWVLKARLLVAHKVRESLKCSALRFLQIALKYGLDIGKEVCLRTN
jgi:hypothetical protein